MTLWTPDGEHPVDRGAGADQTQPGPPEAPQSDYSAGDYGDVDPETAAKMEEHLAQSQAQLLAAPVATVVANHVMGLFELGALHLRAEEPDLESAKLPIDAMGLLVDNLGERLAEHETLTAALAQLRMAFVEMKKHEDNESE